MPVAATYRLQLQPAFPLAAAHALVDYLAALGVSHVYVSPLLRARRGSTHGYDVVDPTVLDPELGTEDDLAALVAALRARGMGLVLDIVPNHMAASDENPFWEDVLAHGPSSPFARWFDLDWGPSGAAPILLPVLGDLRSRVLERGELTLVRRDADVRLRYFEQTFPLDPATLPRLLAPHGPGDPVPPPLAGILARLRALPPRDAADPARRNAALQAVRALARLLAESAPARAELDAAVAAVSHNPTRLRALMDAQAYRLVDWRRAAGETSYRRFFNVSDLVGVRVEDPAVFDATHARVLRWVGRGWLDGLRIDHVDGLWDPLGYLRRLGGAAGVPRWVEKILTDAERLRPEWPVAGTTGYEFTRDVESIFLDPDGVAAIEAWYRRRIARRATGVDFASAARSGKRRILDTWLAPDLRHLTRRLWAIAGHDARARGIGRRDLSTALAEAIVAFPVYRSYVADGPVSGADRAVIDEALARARRERGVAPAAIDLVADVVRLEGVERRPPADAGARRDFVRRLQQTTGPVMAKGVEDTAFYRWVPLASRNEVGAAPGAPVAHAVREFHAANAERASAWPAALVTATTHDTKRSADVRARLDVLSEVAGDWTEHVARWRATNAGLRRRVRGRWAPDPNTEYLLYQSLVGIWPLAAPGAPPDAGDSALADVQTRLAQYMPKAAREAKLQTSWLRPDAAFEDALDAFVAALFAPASAAFLADVARFVGRIARPGLWNALARTLVHLTAPGVPDLYQGDELWSFALADPDNRRAVDFARRRDALAALEATPLDAALVRALVVRAEDGRLKLHVVRAALALRRAEPALFGGGYAPVVAAGATARHVVAFAREAGGRHAITVVPRCTHALAGGAAPVGDVWGDATLALPVGVAAERLTNVLTGEAPGSPRLDAVLGTCPVALLVG